MQTDTDSRSAPARIQWSFSEAPELVLTISPARVARFLAFIVGFLAVAGVSCDIAQFAFGYDRLFGLVPLLRLDLEQNLPTWYQSLALLLAAGIMAAIGVRRRGAGDPIGRYWLLLAGIFLFLSADEAASVHEKVLRVMQSLHHFTGVFHFPWVIPGMLLVVCLGLYYARFLLHLPLRTGLLTVLAALIYLSGALGMEMVGGRYADLHGENNLNYALLTSIEEILEMSGIVLLIFALLDHAANGHKSFQVCLSFKGSNHSS